MFLSHLRRETQPQHAAIERRIDLKRVCESRAAYANHLARMYGFYAPLEEALWRTDAVRETGLRGDERRKTALLLRDLRALGIDPAAQPRCGALPPHAEDGQAMGCLYVLEGASLGGQIITRIVRERLGIRPEDGGAFFHGYGDATGAMWESFRGTLDDYVRARDSRQEAVIGAARATFDTLGEWIGSASGSGGAETRPAPEHGARS